MIHDSEILKIMTEILNQLQIGNYIIKVNNRKILNAIFEISYEGGTCDACNQTSEDIYKSICSSIDNLIVRDGQI